MRIPFIPALLQISLWEMIKTSEPIPIGVMAILLILSILSWTIVFSKWKMFSAARDADRKFLRAFRKSNGLEAVALASEQFPQSPLVSVFDFGYGEIARQIKAKGAPSNKTSIERSLQIGMSEEVAKLEHNMGWLATTATVSPFIGLFGTVWGIMDAFQAMAMSGATSMKAIGPGIAHSLVATALGLAAAIPAAVFYNYFGQVLKRLGARMEDFSLEFLNMADRVFEE